MDFYQKNCLAEKQNALKNAKIKRKCEGKKKKKGKQE